MATFTVRTRFVKPTDTQGPRIRVEIVGAGGKGRKARTLARNYAGEAHSSAVIEYLHALGHAMFALYVTGETRTGKGKRYRVEITG